MSEEPPRLHTCVVCGKTEPWSDDWVWYGSIEENEDDPEKIEKICSAACKKKHKPKPRKRRRANSFFNENARMRKSAKDALGSFRWSDTDDTHLKTP